MKSVLIADDNPAVRKGLRNLFEDNGWYVMGEAENGSQAISMALERRPGMVVMDISMPGASGFEAIEGLRESVPYLPVILFTGSVPQQIKKALHVENICDVLSKDLDLNSLITIAERRYAEAVTEK